MISAAIQAVFGADTAPLQGDAQKAEGILGKLTGSAKSLVAGLSLAAVGGFAKSVIDSAGELQDLSERLGVSTDGLQSFDYAAKQAGAGSAETTKLWEQARKSLDNLHAGSEAQEKAFAKLGLTQRDLMGLTLEQSVEKIAKAYQGAKDTAGAYDAVTDILGTKSTPKLMAVLDQLASEGFEGITRSASAAGQVIDGEFIAAMDRLGDTAATVMGTLKTAAGTVIGFVLSGMEKLGALAGAAVYGGDAMTAAFAESGGAAEKLGGRLDDLTRKAAAKLATDGQLAALADDDFKRVQAVLPVKEQLLAIENRALKLSHEAMLAGQGTAEWATKTLQARKLFDEAVAISAAEQQKAVEAHIAAMDEVVKKEAAALKLKQERAKAATEQFEQEHALKAPLEDQVKHLLKQGTSQEQIVATLRGRGFAEEEILKLIRAQTAGMEQQYQVGLKIKGGRADSDLSDRELAEKISNAKKNLADLERSDPFGNFKFLGNVDRQALENALFEQQRRAAFRRDYAREGEAALLRYSAFDEQTLRNYIRPEDEKRAQQTLEALQTVVKQLRNAGLPTT